MCAFYDSHVLSSFGQSELFWAQRAAWTGKVKACWVCHSVLYLLTTGSITQQRKLVQIETAFTS